MPIEKRPQNPLPKSFVPNNSIPYRVRDGDSWDSVAKWIGVPVWDLIEFNYPTVAKTPRHQDKTAEVNWYLRENVGCNRETVDQKNWMFSSTAKPGLIYLPRAPRVHMFKIRMLGGYSVGASKASIGTVYFQIWDPASKFSAVYKLDGGSAGVGWPPTLAAGSLSGPWNNFTTAKRMAVTDFEGAATMTSSGVGPWGKSMLHLHPKNAPAIHFQDFKGGFSLPAGISTGGGKMTIVPTPHRGGKSFPAGPYNGP